MIYRLADPEVVALLGAFSRVTQRNVGAVEKVLNSYFRERDNLEPVSRKELLRRMRDGLVTLIDTRPEEEFSAGHLPGAINLPLSELKRRLRELPRDQEIVAYCRGPTVSSRMRRWRSCVGEASKPCGSKTDTPSGRQPVCPWNTPRIPGRRSAAASVKAAFLSFGLELLAD